MPNGANHRGPPKPRNLLCLAAPQHVEAVAAASRSVCRFCSDACSDLRIAVLSVRNHKDVAWASVLEFLENKEPPAAQPTTEAPMLSISRLVNSVPEGACVHVSWFEEGESAEDTANALGFLAKAAVHFATGRGLSVEFTFTQWRPGPRDPNSISTMEGCIPLSKWAEAVGARPLGSESAERADAMREFVADLARTYGAASSRLGQRKRKASSPSEASSPGLDSAEGSVGVQRLAASDPVADKARNATARSKPLKQRGGPCDPVGNNPDPLVSRSSSAEPGQPTVPAAGMPLRLARQASSTLSGSVNSPGCGALAPASHRPLLPIEPSGSSAGRWSAGSRSASDHGSSARHKLAPTARPVLPRPSTPLPDQPSVSRGTSLRRGQSLVQKASAHSCASTFVSAAGGPKPGAGTAGQNGREACGEARVTVESLQTEALRTTIQENVAALAESSRRTEGYRPWASTLSHHLDAHQLRRISCIPPPTPTYVDEAQAQRVEEAVSRAILKRNSENGSWLSITMPALPFARLGGIPHTEISTSAVKAPGEASAPTSALAAAALHGATLPFTFTAPPSAASDTNFPTSAPPHSVMVSRASSTFVSSTAILTHAGQRAEGNRLTASLTVSGPPAGLAPQPIALAPLRSRARASLPVKDVTSELLLMLPQAELESDPGVLSQAETVKHPLAADGEGAAWGPAESNGMWASQLATDRLRSVLGSQVRGLPRMAIRLQRLLLDRLRQGHAIEDEKLEKVAAEEAQRHLDEILISAVSRGLDVLSGSPSASGEEHQRI